MRDKIKGLILKVWAKLGLTSKPDVVFILSHMRSGSSLLEHILTTNEQILGFGEQNRIYNQESNLLQMEIFIRWKLKKIFKNYKYVIDQVLHNDYTPNLSLLKNERIKLIFLLRTPIETIASIESLGGFPYNINNKGIYNSINYYTDRLNELMTISKSVPESSQFFLTYHDLINNTDSTLSNLDKFLELKTPLKKEYNLKKSTGKLGDRSKYIKKGEIISTTKNSIQLNNESLEKLNSMYNMTNDYFNFSKC
jgi:hypothetical protein